jgi:pathogenesis-related protein 1
MDEWPSMNHRYQREIFVNTNSRRPAKLFAAGALGLIVTALCVACGGGGSDGPAFAAVTVPPPAATAPIAAPAATPSEAIPAVPTAPPLAVPPNAPPGAPTSAPAAPPTIAPVASPPVATSATPASAPDESLESLPRTLPSRPRATASAAAAATPATGLPQNAFQQEALDAHNRARAEETGKLSSLKWSTKLQSDAQDWVDQCKFSGSVPEGQGQNLYMTPGPSLSAGRAVYEWVKEKYFDTRWDPRAGKQTCVPGQECEHYLQVVERSTTEVGCATKTCSSITDQASKNLGAGTLLVCNYSPAGPMAGQPGLSPK